MTRSNDRDDFREVERDTIKPPPHYGDHHPQVVTADTARQGPAGKRVLAVLVLSLLAALVIFFGCFPGALVNALNEAIKLAGF